VVDVSEHYPGLGTSGVDSICFVSPIGRLPGCHGKMKGCQICSSISCDGPIQTVAAQGLTTAVVK
jgi:hypothetical protein